MRGLIYLASPYTHPDPAMLYLRYSAAMAARASLINQGHLVYSPIVENHEIQKRYKLPGEFAYWQRYNEAMIKACHSFAVLQLEGWKESVGVTAELEIARRLEKPIYYIDPK